MNASQERVWISQREAGTIVSRVLLACGLDPGEIPAATDAVFDAEQAGAAAVRLLLRVVRENTPLGATAAMEGYSRNELDARGAIGFAVAGAVLDLLAECDEDEARLVVHDVRYPEFLLGVGYRLSDRDIRLELDGSTVVAESTRRPSSRPPRPDPRATGYLVPRDAWHELRSISNRALAEDTIVSRSHAGATDLTSDGVIKGDTDDVVAMTELEALYSDSAQE